MGAGSSVLSTLPARVLKRVLLPAVAVIVIALLPQVLGPNMVFLVSLLGAYAIAGFGMVLLTGHTGEFNIGFAALMALGAYGSGYLQQRGWPTALSLVGGLVPGLLLGIVLGIFAQRLTKFALAIVALATVVVTAQLAADLTDITGGFSGSFYPVLPVTELYYLVWALVGASAAVVSLILTSWVGRSLRAVRDSEIAAEMFGLSPGAVKFFAFIVSSLLGSLSGGLYALVVGVVFPDTFAIIVSLNIFVIVIVGGMRSLWGALLGALLLVSIPEATRTVTGLDTILIGLFGVLILMLKPTGIVGILSDLGRSIRAVSPRLSARRVTYDRAELSTARVPVTPQSRTQL